MDERQAVIRLDSPARIAAAVPSLVGFTPDDGSIVVVTLVGKRVGLTLRADYGPLLGEQLADAVLRHPEITSAHVIGWGVLPVDTDYVYGRMRDSGVPVIECLTVRKRDGAWQVVDTCPDNADPEWEPLPDDVVRAPMVARGHVVEDSRERLVERIVYSPGQQLTDAQADVAGRLTDVRQRDKVLALLAALDVDELAPLREDFCAVARAFEPADLRRDAGLTVVGLISYLMGDGAMARIALDEVTPTYSMARLLRQALTVSMPPQIVRAAVVAAWGDVQ
jgi:hypothetical protein